MNTAMTLKKRIFSVLLTVILLFSMMPLSVFAANDAAAVTAFDFSLGGDDAANYVLTAQPASTTATVSATELTIAGLKVRDKPYDGKNIPAIDGTPTLVGVVDGDKIGAVDGITADNAKRENKEALEEAKKTLESALRDFDGNRTAEESKAL